MNDQPPSEPQQWNDRKRVGNILMIVGAVCLAVGLFSCVGGVAMYVTTIVPEHRLVIPGQTTQSLDRGMYHVFLETQSEVMGARKGGSVDPADLKVSISDASGNPVLYRSPTNIDVDYDFPTYTGELIGSFELPAAGTITLDAQTTGGTITGEPVLAFDTAKTVSIVAMLVGCCGGGPVTVIGVVLLPTGIIIRLTA